MTTKQTCESESEIEDDAYRIIIRPKLELMGPAEADRQPQPSPSVDDLMAPLETILAAPDKFLHEAGKLQLDRVRSESVFIATFPMSKQRRFILSISMAGITSAQQRSVKTATHIEMLLK